MKCTNCNTEFKGNFCPACGARADAAAAETVANDATPTKSYNNASTIDNKSAENSESVTVTDVVKGGASYYISWRLKFMFIGALGAGIFMCAMGISGWGIGMVILGVIMLVLGVLLMPFMTKKYKKWQFYLLVFLAIGCAGLAACIYDLDEDNGNDIQDYDAVQVQQVEENSSDDTESEKDWYKTYTRFTSKENNHILEIVSGDGIIQAILDETRVYDGSEDGYTVESDNVYVYDIDPYGARIKYYPNNGHCVEIVAGGSVTRYLPISNDVTAKPEPAASTTPEIDTNMDSEYIFPHSDTIEIDIADLLPLNEEQRTIARNEIYARHGREFQTKWIQEYFDSCSWYTVNRYYNYDNEEGMLNAIELHNVKVIADYENSLK